MSDPVNSARARVAYYSRKDVGDPSKIPAARREFALAKLERCIRETLEFTGTLTTEERERVFSVIGDTASTAA